MGDHVIGWGEDLHSEMAFNRPGGDVAIIRIEGSGTPGLALYSRYQGRDNI